MYFAIEINDGQKCPYMLEEIGTFLDYYVVKIDDSAFLEMNLVPYNPIPLTPEEAEAVWFAGIRTGRVKIPLEIWDKFGRERKPEYELSVKGKIIYPITRQDEINAVSLMRKILDRKLSIWLDNQYFFYGYTQDLNDIDEKYSNKLKISDTLVEMANVYFDMQKELYKQDIEHKE